ncbi:transcriptional repressor NrdR [candidate division KSB1 bacterium]|nr:transcriptional repressor NrdR [candidate division KSB1 bacterium]
MRCPFCNYHDTKVIDSRTRNGGRTIRRRRECLKCRRRFTTKEHVEHIPLWVVKRDGRREEFDPKKLIRGIQFACIKRPVSVAKIEEMAFQIEFELRDKGIEEVESIKLGEAIMKGLKKLDEVAFVRFASVYRNFQVKEEFLNEVKHLK